MTEVKDKKENLVSNRIKDEFLASKGLVGRVADTNGTYAPILNHTGGTVNFTDYTCTFTSRAVSPLAKRGFEFNGENYSTRNMSLSYVLFVADYMRNNADNNFRAYVDGAFNHLRVELGQAKRQFATCKDANDKSKYEFKIEGLNQTLDVLTSVCAYDSKEK